MGNCQDRFVCPIFPPFRFFPTSRHSHPAFRSFGENGNYETLVLLNKIYFNEVLYAVKLIADFIVDGQF